MGKKCDSSKTQVTADEFQISSLQATVFTPDEGYSSKRVMKQLYPKWSDIFDGEPIILPSESPPIMPAEIPRIILQGKSSPWRCEFAPARVNLFWRKPNKKTKAPTLEGFYKKATEMLSEYSDILQLRVGRLAGVITRFVKHPNPASHLAQHFCKENMCMGSGDTAPLNRPESFELHAHKRFLLAKTLQVNSWVRHKTGTLTINSNQSPIILVEQDINTLPEHSDSESFDKERMSMFFLNLTKEFGITLRLYFPGRKKK